MVDGRMDGWVHCIYSSLAPVIFTTRPPTGLVPPQTSSTVHAAQVGAVRLAMSGFSCPGDASCCLIFREVCGTDDGSAVA
jgi:hypothetical protein